MEDGTLTSAGCVGAESFVGIIEELTTLATSASDFKTLALPDTSSLVLYGAKASEVDQLSSPADCFEASCGRSASEVRVVGLTQGLECLGDLSTRLWAARTFENASSKTEVLPNADAAPLSLPKFPLLLSLLPLTVWSTAISPVRHRSPFHRRFRM